jgi:hypothetical protein
LDSFIAGKVTKPYVAFIDFGFVSLEVVSNVFFAGPQGSVSKPVRRSATCGPVIISKNDF